MGYQIKIKDNKNEIIGEMMSADNSDIIKLINKGLRVVNVQTNEEFNKDSLIMESGVSDGLIEY
jgi:hypothetical protein